MKKIIQVTAIRNKIEICITALCIILFLARSSIPFFKFPFIIISGALGIYILTIYLDKILSSLKYFITITPLILILFVYLILAGMFSDKIYLMVVKDVFNAIVLLTLLLVMVFFIDNSQNLQLFYKYFISLFIIFALVISIQRIYSFFYISSYSEYFNDLYVNPGRLTVDRNFALIPIFFGMAGIFGIFYQKLSKYKLIIFNISLFIFSIAILLSGSRRGVFLFFILYLIILTGQLYGFFRINKKFKQLCKNSGYYLYSFSLSLIIMVFIIFNTSVYFKNNVLAYIGVENISFTKGLISNTIFRYVHFLNKNLDEDSIYSKIWTPVFDSKDPEAWSGNGNYKIAKNLSGKNIEIVPAMSKGYLLDSSSLGHASPYHSYYFLSIKEYDVNKGDSMVVSVYCYVSDDFDGNAVALRTGGSIIGEPDKYYDLLNKGCWQKLTVPLNCLQGNITVYLYMNKGGVQDFSDLKGYVIFAYPEIQVIQDSGACCEKLKLTAGENKIHNYPNNVLNLNSNTLKIQTHRAGFLNLKFLIPQISSENNTDPIRDWIEKIVSEDTTYSGYKADLVFMMPEDIFGEDRTTLWKFALEIFNKEFNWRQKIFGGGFNFLNWYGYCFGGDKTKSEYPHNPFLHILLYSGIFGLLIYCFFLYKVFYYYIKYIKEYPLLFIFFLITFFFTLFSGGSPFDPPIMGFFSILPFFIHAVHKHGLPKNSDPEKQF